jgi:hypothetical protein
MRNVHEEMSDNNSGHECGASVHQFDPVPYAQYSPVSVKRRFEAGVDLITHGKWGLDCSAIFEQLSQHGLR